MSRAETLAPDTLAPNANTLARVAAALCLVLLVVGPFSLMVVPSAIVVPGDAAATVTNLIARPDFFRAGLLGELVIATSEVAMTAALYVLFRPVSRWLSWGAAAARLAMLALQAVGVSYGLAALSLARSGADADLVMALLDLHGAGAVAWQALFAVHCAMLGVLAYRSRFVPRVLGMLMAVAAGGYGLVSFGVLVLPEWADLFTAVAAATSMFGELPLFLWLGILGVRRREERRSFLAGIVTP